MIRPGQVELPTEKGSHPKLGLLTLDLQIFLWLTENCSQMADFLPTYDKYVDKKNQQNEGFSVDWRAFWFLIHVRHYVDVYQRNMFMLMFISAKNRSKNFWPAKYSIVPKHDICTMWNNIFWPFFKKNLKIIKNVICNWVRPKFILKVFRLKDLYSKF